MAEQRCGSCKTMVPLEGFSPSYRGKTGTWCRACFAAYTRGDRSPRVEHEPRRCTWCNGSHVPGQLKGTSLFCSRSCKQRARYDRLRRERLEGKPEQRACLQCGAAFGAERRSDAKFCTEECNSNAHSLKRKLRARGGPEGAPGYVRIQIAERDKWRCGICGGAVSKERRWPDPLTGSLDHIVPVSQGGTSEPANLRLTHLQCNVRRRDRGGGEQLALH